MFCGLRVIVWWVKLNVLFKRLDVIGRCVCKSIEFFKILCICFFCVIWWSLCFNFEILFFFIFVLIVNVFVIDLEVFLVLFFLCEVVFCKRMFFLVFDIVLVFCGGDFEFYKLLWRFVKNVFVLDKFCRIYFFLFIWLDDSYGLSFVYM